jgi:hypothetical protein
LDESKIYENRKRRKYSKDGKTISNQHRKLTLVFSQKKVSIIWYLLSENGNAMDCYKQNHALNYMQ